MLNYQGVLCIISTFLNIPNPKGQKVGGLFLNIPLFQYVDDFFGFDDLTWPSTGMLCAMLFFRNILFLGRSVPKK